MLPLHIYRSSAKLHIRGIRHVRNLSLKTRPKLAVPNLGQPTHETRRHLIPEPGNLTPGISALEYYERRLKLAAQLPANSAAILVGNGIQHSSGSVFYDFQPDTDMFYLTGWREPNSVAVIEKVAETGTDEDVRFHMLVPAKDPFKELWEGDRTGLEGAYDVFNADEVHDIDRLEHVLKMIIQRNDTVYYDDKNKGLNLQSFPNFFSFSFGNKASSTVNGLLKAKSTKSLRKLIGNLRLYKSQAEQKVMHRAGKISSRAINKAMARVGSDQPFKTEKTLAKYLDYAFVRGGCDKEAYIPVVASGSNALTIHYTRNDDLLYEDEMVFIDAGGKLGEYCADISRTWPNSPAGFSDAQRDIYNVVLDTNKELLKLCTANSYHSIYRLHEKSVEFLTLRLRDLPGFGGVTRAQVRELYPHFVGHHLGLDLHDIPYVSHDGDMKENMVITVEPGLYIPANDKWPKHYHGIGVRVEDDVLVGEKQPTVLTSLCAKEVADVELLIRLGRATTPGIYDEAVQIDI